jgi:hypothetical protein
VYDAYFDDKVAEELQGVESIQSSLENVTILLRIFSYFGKDVNLIMAWEAFKLIFKKESKKVYEPEDLRVMFIIALRTLKFMGIVSATK